MVEAIVFLSTQKEKRNFPPTKKAKKNIATRECNADNEERLQMLMSMLKEDNVDDVRNFLLHNDLLLLLPTYCQLTSWLIDSSCQSMHSHLLFDLIHHHKIHKN